MPAQATATTLVLQLVREQNVELAGIRPVLGQVEGALHDGDGLQAQIYRWWRPCARGLACFILGALSFWLREK
jgi:hypothetical protein